MLNSTAVLTTAGLSQLEKAAKTCPLPIENLTDLCYNHIQKNTARAGSLWHNADLAPARKKKSMKNNVHSIDQRQSWQADADKWGEWIASPKPLTDLDTEVADLKTYLKSRQEWVKDNLDSITKVYCTVKFEADGEPKAAAATSNPKTNAVQGLGVLTIAAAAIIITAKKKHR